MYSFTEDGVRSSLESLFDEEAIIHLSHPFGDILCLLYTSDAADE